MSTTPIIVKQALDSLNEKAGKRMDTMQKQLDAIDMRVQGHPVGSGGFGSGDLERELKENDSVARLVQDKKGTAIINLPSRLLERKTLITSSGVGSATSGVLQIDRVPGIVAEARQVLRVRDLLTARPTALQVIDFVKVSAPMANASPQAEGSEKHENEVAFTTASAQVKTIATWVPATKQVLDDFTELLAFIQGSLSYYVDAEEELQILSGDNTGQNLNGLITQATPFDAGLLAGSWNYIDVIGRACQQIATAKETQPTFVVLNPADWWTIRLTKDDYGRYVLGDPMGPVNVQALFGLIPVPTTNIALGTFLVGAGTPEAVEIRDRQETTVEISTQHSDYFTKNKIAVRAEKRMALVCKRPAAFVRGSFSMSPA
jgi:HK97 family phage major capsid protein